MLSAHEATRRPGNPSMGLCNVARGWAGSCIITIKKPRESGRQDSDDPREVDGRIAPAQ